MHINCPLFSICCQGYQHQSCVQHHVTGADLWQYKFHKASLDIVPAHCFQKHICLEVVFFMLGIHMGIHNIFCFFGCGRHRIQDNGETAVRRIQPLFICLKRNFTVCIIFLGKKETDLIRAAACGILHVWGTHSKYLIPFFI